MCFCLFGTVSQEKGGLLLIILSLLWFSILNSRVYTVYTMNR